MCDPGDGAGGKLPSWAPPGPPTCTVPCQGTGEAGPANQPACCIAGSMGPSLGHAWSFWHPTYLLAQASAWILHLLCPVSPAGSVCPGAGPMPCLGTVTCHCQLSPCRPGWCRAGTEVLWAAFVLGRGLWGSHEGSGSSGWTGLAWWPSWVFQTVISAWLHPFTPAIPDPGHPSAPARGRIGCPTGRVWHGSG